MINDSGLASHAAEGTFLLQKHTEEKSATWVVCWHLAQSSGVHLPTSEILMHSCVTQKEACDRENIKTSLPNMTNAYSAQIKWMYNTYNIFENYY